MNVDPDYRYTYDVPAEAWYGHTIAGAPRIGVHRSHVDGGVAWEFSIEEHDLNGPTLLLRTFGDAWDAFGDVPELFEALRTEQPDTLTELRALLGGLGFEDITKRTRAQDGSRCWLRGDPEPDDVRSVRDVHGDVWTRGLYDIWSSPETVEASWTYIAKKFGPLTEVQ